MKTWARIENDCVAEIVTLDVKPLKLYHPSLVWVDITGLTEPPGVTYSYRDGVFTPPVIVAENDAMMAGARLAAEMDEANRIITPLQDAEDLKMATPDETARLEAWRKYRVLLNRVDVAAAPAISWPEKPAS
ncbi:tail fiber assembly protein [Pantoea ananatis]|uniref:tail fiber assembly protein n=1 Tax=Pantoea ananas TaxID=553 RepID=UPI001B312740|nr:tail fiber assembly protein [Pantoea ananatis]